MHYVLEELRWNIDAAIGNAIIERRWRGEAFWPALLGVRSYDWMHGDGAFVVDPEYFLAAGIVAHLRNETACRRCALLGTDARYRHVANTGGGLITWCQSNQYGCRASQLAFRVEYVGFGVHFIDNSERHIAIVA